MDREENEAGTPLLVSDDDLQPTATATEMQASGEDMTQVTRLISTVVTIVASNSPRSSHAKSSPMATTRISPATLLVRSVSASRSVAASALRVTVAMQHSVSPSNQESHQSRSSVMVSRTHKASPRRRSGRSTSGAKDEDADEDAMLSAKDSSITAPAARCIKMPALNSVRIVIAALPPSVFGAPKAGDEGATLEDKIRAMWRWSQGSDNRDPYSRIRVAGERSSARLVTASSLRAAIINGAGRRDTGAAVVRAGNDVLERAASITVSRMAALASVEASHPSSPRMSRNVKTDKSGDGYEYEYSTVSWRDLERVVVAGLLSSPYARVMDLRNATAHDLEHVTTVLVPFPLSRLRGMPRRAAELRAVAKEYVPTLWASPGKHAFTIARIIRDMASLRSLAHTLRPLVREQPWIRAQYWSFEPFWSSSLPRSQRTLPYPASAGRRRRADTAASDGTDGRAPPRWHPADPMYYRRAAGLADNPCDPLLENGRLRVGAAPDGCTLAEEAAAIAAERPILLSFMGAPRGSMPERVTMFHTLRACDTCALFDVRSPIFRDGFGMPWLYSTSVFCAQPHGDSPSRKGLFDAIAYGCIPVVLDKRDPAGRGRAPVLPFSGVLPWGDLAVRVTRSEWFGLGIARAVRRLSPTRVREMQIALARHAHLLAFLLPDAPSMRALTNDVDVAAVGGARRLSAEGRRRHGRYDDDSGVSHCARDAIDLLVKQLADR